MIETQKVPLRSEIPVDEAAAGHGQAGVLQKHAEEHDRVAVAREEIDDPVRHGRATVRQRESAGPR